MSAVRDNWERLTSAVLRREQLRYLSRLDSISTTDSADSFRLNTPPLCESSLHLRELGYSFPHRKIVKATNSFSDENLIHRGSSGDFFRADLVVASSSFSRRKRYNLVVKRFDLKLVSNQEAYLHELTVSSKAWNSESSFFAFVGQCLEMKDEKFFVYKLASHGDLSNALIKKKPLKRGELPTLNWITRTKIAMRTAAGLAYLHQKCSPPLFHGDVQASSILVDSNFEVRLGSLGHSCSQQTHDDDDWFFSGRESEMYTSGMGRANDVYCFGKVLLELVTGKLGISAATNKAITDEWLEAEFLCCISEDDMEMVRRIVDPTMLINQDHFEEVWSMAIVSKYCLNPQPQQRPLVTHVLQALENPSDFITAVRTTSLPSWPAEALLQIILS